MFNLLLSVGFAVLVTATLVQFALAFRASEGTVWERLLATSRHSATWLWSKVLLVAGSLIQVAQNAATWLNMPEVSTFIQANLPPEWVGYMLLFVAVMTFLSRMRSLVDK